MSNFLKEELNSQIIICIFLTIICLLLGVYEGRDEGITYIFIVYLLLSLISSIGVLVLSIKFFICNAIEDLEEDMAEAIQYLIDEKTY